MSNERDVMVFIMATAMIDGWDKFEVQQQYLDPDFAWFADTLRGSGCTREEKLEMVRDNMRAPKLLEKTIVYNVDALQHDERHKLAIAKACKMLNGKRELYISDYGDIVHIANAFSPVGGEFDKKLAELNVYWREQSETYTYYVDIKP